MLLMSTNPKLISLEENQSELPELSGQLNRDDLCISPKVAHSKFGFDMLVVRLCFVGGKRHAMSTDLSPIKS